MHTTNLRKVGGSVMLAVPPAILDLLHLEAGSTVGLAVDREGLMVRPQPKPKYTLDELLAQCKASPSSGAKSRKAVRTDEERAWLELPPAGREL